MAFAFKDLATGAVNSTSPTTIYTAPLAGTKVQELTLSNATGADVECVVTIGTQFFGRWIVPGADKIRGNQTTITRNKGMNSGQTITLAWTVASPLLAHHLSGTELG